MRPQAAVARTLRLYPPWWRDRYGEEVGVVADDLAESGRSLGPMLAGLIWGALRARLGARGMPANPDLWEARARASMVLAAAPVLVVVPLVLTIRQSARRTLGPVPPTHLVSAAYLGLLIGFLGLVVTALWGYTSLTAGLSEGGERAGVSPRLVRAPRQLSLLGVAFYVGALVFEPRAFRDRPGRAPIPFGGHPALSFGLDVGAAALVAGSLVALAVLLARMVRRSASSPRSLQSGRRVSVSVSVLLALMTVAAAMVTLGSGQLGAPSAQTVSVTLLGGSLWTLVALLGLAAAVSALGAVMATRSVRASIVLRAA
jgi:hypothetical protein